MTNYEQLIQKIFNCNDPQAVDHTKKLIYLAVNDSKNFSPFADQVVRLVGQSLHELDDDQLKKLFLQLLSEIATNYYERIPASHYNFNALIELLSDENPEIRKASHYLLLIFIKKYEKIDEVISSYMKQIESNPDQWKTIQKIIHSFQSLLVIEPKCITYGKNHQDMDHFLKMLLAFRAHHHHLIQKASDQTVSSFVKNEYTPQVLPKLDGKIMAELITYAQKLNIKLTVNKDHTTLLHVDDEADLEEIKIGSKTPHKKPQKQQHSKMREVLEGCLKRIEGENDWKIKLEAVEAISGELSNCTSPDDIPKDLLDKVLDLTYDYNFKTCITAMNIILSLVTKFPDMIAQKSQQLQDVIIEKICDLKMAVRQIASRILKRLYEVSTRAFNRKILNKLSNCSVVGKQEILNFIQENYSSTHSNDLAVVLGEISTQLMNENTRIKIKTIDCLVKISISNNLDDCKQILQKKLNKVYFDMFLDRLKEKVSSEDKPDYHGGWENDKNLHKGMTWQAERSAPIEPTDKQSMTKVEFTKKSNNSHNAFNQKNAMVDTIEDFGFDHSAKKTEEKSTLKSFSNKTANTFDTFQSEDSVNYKLSKKNTSQSKAPSKQTSSFLSRDNFEAQWKADVEERKIPLKPNPIRKKNPGETSINASINTAKQENLVIQSKEYITKNDSEKPSYETSYSKKEVTPKTAPKEPFSIKKSSMTSSKQPHQIDYKGTYYAAKDELSPLDNTHAALKEIITTLPKDNDWSKQFDSLNLLRRFVKNHENKYGDLHESLPSIMPQVLKLVESLRSSLAKNAMITLSEMCEALKKAMDPFLEPIFIKLFKKAQDANSFIVEEVSKCMTSLCEYCSSHKITSIIVMHSQAKATPIKAKVGLCVDKILLKHEYDVSALKENTKLVAVMNTLIGDSSAEVRNLIKETFENICRSNQKGKVQEIFKKTTTKDSWEKFKKILDKESKYMGF